MKLVQNVARLLSTPGMPAAYSRWVWSSLRGAEGPAVSCANTKIRGWINFSDYWDFHGGVSEGLHRLIERTLRNTVSARPVAFDIGAHLGLFTAELAGRGFAEVHSFEPAPATFAKLKTNMEASPSARGVVKLNCLAVGPTNGSVEFEVAPDSPATNHVRLPGTQDNLAVAQTRVQQVPMITLDRYCEERKIERIDFVKMDTEGLEPYVLDGAQQCLRNGRISVMVFESCPSALERGGTSVAILHQRLLSNGYQPHELRDDGELGTALTVGQMEEISASGSLSACGHGADLVAIPIS